MESTYGVSRHLPREEREQRFVVSKWVGTAMLFSMRSSSFQGPG